MAVIKTSVQGDPNIGLFGLATDKYVFISESTPVRNVSGVSIITSTISGTSLCGMFCAGNSHGLLLPSIVADREFEVIKEVMNGFNVNVARLEGKYTAIGNLIVCNDSAALASPLLKPQQAAIEECLKVPVTFGKIARLDIVGSLCVATNKGFLLSTYATERDFDFVEETLDTKGDVGTINFGGPFIGSGLIANSSYAIVGEKTTGPELARIGEAFGFDE